MSEDIAAELTRELQLKDISRLYDKVWPAHIYSLSNEVERLKTALWDIHGTASEAATYTDVSSDDAVVNIRDAAMAALDPESN
ncbi:MAG: hypothetical protein CL942_14140 [Desulfovibrio sp.]|nr:hypothetical protein [Desulfovibrio sp.]|tara:strand:+ start:1092 stop:1340 length:249 start_codon:yes stop_codon:yes gene_type:complete